MKYYHGNHTILIYVRHHR